MADKTFVGGANLLLLALILGVVAAGSSSLVFVPAGLLALLAVLLMTGVIQLPDSSKPHIGMGAEIQRGALVEPGATVEMGATVKRGAIVRSGAVVRMGADVGRDAVIEAN